MPQNNIISFVILGVLLAACDSNRVYDVYKSLPHNTWHKDSLIQFKITPPDSVTPYNLFINLRNTNTYQYNNLFLIVRTRFPHGKTIADTLTYRMAAPDGTLLGKGFSDMKENKLWYKENVVFQESGTYLITIQQAMRKNGDVHGIESLQGVSDVGFRIEKTAAARH